MDTLFKVGDKVTYVQSHKREKGIIKSVADNEHVFVVYACGGNWNEYSNYTAARTRVVDLVPGWEKARDALHEPDLNNRAR